MRLIGTLQAEQEASKFYSFLQQEEIECSYHPTDGMYQFWVMHEDQIEIALHWLEEFKKNPEDPRFETKKHPIDTEGVAAETKKEEPIEVKAFRLRKKARSRTPLTQFIILICALLYIWNGSQMRELSKIEKNPEFFSLTPLMINLSYDMPKAPNREALSEKLFAKEQGGVWDGIYGVLLGWPASKKELAASMFTQIRSGEIWRLITPVFLHGNLLHILFNMLWLWMLGKQVEERIQKWQYITITIIIGVVSNTAQYLMSGPLFIGYSGIICGLAGFIWTRQRRAPWEGYPLQKGTVIFLAVFVIAMLGLQLTSFVLMRFELAKFDMNIANTAHITGALTGILLGRIPLFSKGAA